MRIVFKEVGQGDTIILEWEVDGQKKIAIIDCNISGSGNNPALVYLDALTLTRIEFIIISHPHYDHFSGMSDVLNLCAKKGISIGLCMHTMPSHPAYLTSAVKGNIETGALAELCRNLQKLIKSGTIQDHVAITHLCRPIKLQGDWLIHFLGPAASEYDTYNRNAYKHLNDNDPKIQAANANLLSTLLKISNGKEYVLLTSDITKNVFRKIQRKGMQNFKDLLILGQLSHHGSIGDYYETFWKQTIRKPKTPIAISVGENDYGHPSDHAINSLKANDFFVLRTDVSRSASSKEVLGLLGLISSAEKTSPISIGKDISFDFNTMKIS